MSTERPSMTDKELWRSVVLEDKATSGTISDHDLAAWLEGRLSPVEADRVDEILAADPRQRAAALELSEILAMPLPAAPARVAVRAQALVGFKVEREPAPRPGFLAFLFATSLFTVGRRQALRSAAMGTAAIDTAAMDTAAVGTAAVGAMTVGAATLAGGAARMGARDGGT